MTRSIKGQKAPGYDYNSRRLNGYPSPGVFTKKITHRRERIEGQATILQQIEDEATYFHMLKDFIINEEAEESYYCYMYGPCDKCGGISVRET